MNVLVAEGIVREADVDQIDDTFCWPQKDDDKLRAD